MNEKRSFILCNPEIRYRATMAVSNILIDTDHPMEVTIQPYRKKRSLDQNEMLWAIYQKVSDETGHSAEELHEICKAMFVGMKRIEYKSAQGHEVKIEIPYSSTNLNTKEFSKFLEQVQAWAAQEFAVHLSD